MNGKRIALMAIAVIAMGTFALPGTVSLFAGQHTWFDLGGIGNDVPCEKCHADIAEEMSLTGPHVDMECWYCHKTANLTGFIYASGDGTGGTSGREAHAASTVECMDCHEGFGIDVFTSCTSCHFTPTPVHPTEWFYEPCGNCHAEYAGAPHFTSVLEAGGFNLTVNPDDTGTAAAHKTFVMTAINNTHMEGANEACIACHTHAAVKINWTHRVSLEFNCTPEFDLPPTHFNVSEFTANGTYNVTVYGNGTGGGSTSGFP